MKKVIMLEENELEELVKNAMIAKAVLYQVLNHMDNNMEHDDMGVNSSNIADIYSKIQSAHIAIDRVNDVLR